MKPEPKERTVKKRDSHINKNTTFKKKLQDNIGKLHALKDPQLLEKIGIEQAQCHLMKTIIATSAQKNSGIQLKDLVTSTPHYTKCTGDRFFTSATSSLLSPIHALEPKQNQANQGDIGSDSSEIRTPRADYPNEQNSSLIYIGTENIISSNLTLRKNRKNEDINLGEEKRSPDKSQKRSRTVESSRDRHLIKKSKIPLRTRSQDGCIISVNAHESPHRGAFTSELVPKQHATPSTKGQTHSINKKPETKTVKANNNHKDKENKLTQEIIKKSNLEANESNVEGDVNTKNISAVSNENDDKDKEGSKSPVTAKDIRLSPIARIEDDQNSSKAEIGTSAAAESPPKNDSVPRTPLADKTQEAKLQANKSQALVTQGTVTDNDKANEELDKESSALDLIEEIKLKNKNATKGIQPNDTLTSDTVFAEVSKITKLDQIVTQEELEARRERWETMFKKLEEVSQKADLEEAEANSNSPSRKKQKLNNLATKSLIEVNKRRKSVVSFAPPRKRHLSANDSASPGRSALRDTSRPRQTVNKEIQTSDQLNRPSNSARVTLFRRISLRKELRNRSYVSMTGVCLSPSEDKENPNIFDSLEQGNELDVLLNSDVNATAVSSVEKPWRFEDDRASLEPSGNVKLNFIRSESDISYRSLGKTATDLDQNSSRSETMAKRRISLAEVSRNSKPSRRSTKSKSYIVKKKYEKKKNDTVVTPNMEDIIHNASTNLSSNNLNITKPRDISNAVEETHTKTNRTRITQYDRKSKPAELVIELANLDTTISSRNLRSSQRTVQTSTLNENPKNTSEHQNDVCNKNTQSTTQLAETTSTRLGKGKEAAPNATIKNSETQKDATFKSPGEIVAKKNHKRSTKSSLDSLCTSNIIQTEDGGRPKRTRKPVRFQLSVDIEKLGLVLVDDYKKRRNTSRSISRATKKGKKTNGDELSNINTLPPIEQNHIDYNIEESARSEVPSESGNPRKDVEAQVDVDTFSSAKATKSNAKGTKKGRKPTKSNTTSSQKTKSVENEPENPPLSNSNPKAAEISSSSCLPSIEDSHEPDPIFQNHVEESATAEQPGPPQEPKSPYRENEAQVVTDTTGQKPKRKSRKKTTIYYPKKTKKDNKSERSNSTRSQTTRLNNNTIGNESEKPSSSKVDEVSNTNCLSPIEENRELDPAFQCRIEKATAALPEQLREPEHSCRESGLQGTTDITDTTDKGSKMFDRNSNFPSALQLGCSGSVVNSRTDFDAVRTRSSVLANDDFVTHIVAGKVYDLRFISKIPSLSMFINLGNLNVFESVRDPHDCFTAGFMRLEANDRKRPTSCRKYSFIYNVISGTAHVQLNGKKGVANQGNFFYIPKGITYSIINPSPQRDLLLSYTRIREEDK